MLKLTPKLNDQVNVQSLGAPTKLSHEILVILS